MTNSTNGQISKANVAEVDALLESSFSVPYVYATLLEFSKNIDAASDVTRAAFEKAIVERRAVEFTNLYAACGLAGHLPGTWVLAEGVPLSVDFTLLLSTILDLDGDLTPPVLHAVNSGRLTSEREGMLLLALRFMRERWRHGIGRGGSQDPAEVCARISRKR